MIDKQAAIDAIVSETVFKTVDELRRNISFCERESGWTGGILTAIQAIEDMDETDSRLTPKPVDVHRDAFRYKHYYCPACGREFKGPITAFCSCCGQDINFRATYADRR